MDEAGLPARPSVAKPSDTPPSWLRATSSITRDAHGSGQWRGASNPWGVFVLMRHNFCTTGIEIVSGLIYAIVLFNIVGDEFVVVEDGAFGKAAF